MASEKSVFEVEVTVAVRVSPQDIDDIMCTALEGGITYWCGKASVVGKFLGNYANEQISRGGALVLHDAESSDTWELTRDKFLLGLRLYIEQTEPPCVDVDDIDSEVADIIIQYGLFGELVFG